MRPISFRRRRFPPDVIRHAVWLYCRFTLSIRDVEELLAQRGVEVSREAVRCGAGMGSRDRRRYFRPFRHRRIRLPTNAIQAKSPQMTCRNRRLGFESPPLSSKS